MQRLRTEVTVHPDGTIPGAAPMKRYPAGTPVTELAESEGWQLCDDHFFDDDHEHPQDVVDSFKRFIDQARAFGSKPPRDIVDWVATQEAAIAAEQETDDAVR